MTGTFYEWFNIYCQVEPGCWLINQNPGASYDSKGRLGSVGMGWVELGDRTGLLQPLCSVILSGNHNQNQAELDMKIQIHNCQILKQWMLVKNAATQL